MKPQQWLKETLPTFGTISVKSTLVMEYFTLFDFAQWRCLFYHSVTTARNHGISAQVEKHHLDMLQFVYLIVLFPRKGSYEMSQQEEGVM